MNKKIIVLLTTLLIISFSGCANMSTQDHIQPFHTEQTENPTKEAPNKSEITLPILSREERESIITDLINSEESIDIHLSPDESYMCGIGSESNHVVVLNAENQVVFNQVITAQEDDEFYLYFNGWSDNNKWLWITQQHTFFIDYFSLINLETGSVNHLKQEYGFQTDYAFNPNNGYLCFSTIPHFLDVDSREEFNDVEHELSLYLVNIFEDSDTEWRILNTSTSRAFRPVWTDDYTIEYDAPYTSLEETERITFSFNQTYTSIGTSNTTETNKEKAKRIIDFQNNEKVKGMLNIQDNTKSPITETIDLYGYSIPIQLINLYEGGTYTPDNCIDWWRDYNYLYIPTNDENDEDVRRLADFFSFKYSDETVDWLMDRFKRGNGVIEFTDGTYIMFSKTTAGFRGVSCGYIRDKK